MYAGTDPADYGVQVQDTTFDIIKENADQQKVLSAQQPPNAACRVGCWVPEIHAGTFSTVNRCARCTLQPAPYPGSLKTASHICMHQPPRLPANIGALGALILDSPHRAACKDHTCALEMIVQYGLLG